MKTVLIQNRYGEILEKRKAIIKIKLRPYDSASHYVYLVLTDNLRVRRVMANIFSGVLFAVV